MDINEYFIAARIDQLEGVTNFEDEETEQEEYSDLQDLKLKGVSGVTKNRRLGGGTRFFLSNSNDSIPKEFKPRSLSSIIIEEASLGKNGVCRSYLAAEAKPIKRQGRPPERKICPVTGLFGAYIDPKSGIPFAKVSALEKIRDHPPPWLNLSKGVTTSSYFEALKSLRCQYNL